SSREGLGPGKRCNGECVCEVAHVRWFAAPRVNPPPTEGPSAPCMHLSVGNFSRYNLPPMLAVFAGKPQGWGSCVRWSEHRGKGPRALRVGMALRVGRNGSALQEATRFWPDGLTAGGCGGTDGMGEHCRAANKCAQVLGQAQCPPMDEVDARKK